MNDNAHTLREVAAEMTQRLIPLYGEREARAMTNISIERTMGYTPVDRVLKSGETVSEFRIGQLNAIIDRLLKEEPLQYILGEATFYGMRLAVNPAVLIPRPETEELVDMIVKQNVRSDLKVLDIGTGSGCIAIALARNLRFADVTGIDISDTALETATANAAALKANVKFRKADALHLTDRPLTLKWDIIVSNPPYIAEHEQSVMERNVLEHEPHTALFVPDDDPLKFYRSILEYGANALLPGGEFYFEINPLYANELAAEARRLMKESTVEIVNDIHGRQRFAIISTPTLC